MESLESRLQDLIEYADVWAVNSQIDVLYQVKAALQAKDAKISELTDMSSRFLDNAIAIVEAKDNRIRELEQEVNRNIRYINALKGMYNIHV